MSFAEGFGSAFSKSFNAGLEREEEKKKDQFRIAYADLVERRKERETNKAKEAAQIKQAQSITGLAGAPAEAWPKVFEMLNSGISPDKIREDIAAGTFNIGGSKPKAPTTASTGEAAPMDAIDVPADAKPTPEAAFPTEGVAQQPTPEAPVDQQMQGTGMAPKAPTPPAPVGPTAPAAPKKNMFTGLLSDLSGKFKGGATKAPTATGAPNPANNDAYARIGKGLNQTPEQVSETINAPMYQVGQGVPDASNIQFTPARAAPKDEIKDLDGAFRAQARAAATLQANPQDTVAQQQYEAASRDLEATKAAAVFSSNARAISEGNYAGITGIPALIVGPNGETDFASVTPNPDGSFNNIGVMDAQGSMVGGGKVAPNARVIPYNEAELKFLTEKIAPANATVAKEVREKAGSVVPMMRNFGIMSQLVDETNGQVLHPWTAGAARKLVSAARDVGNSIDLFNSAVANNKGIVTPEMIEELRKKTPPSGTDLASFLGPDVNNLAAKSALFESAAIVAAYDMAKARGQTGQGLSNKDLEINKQSLVGSGSKDVFKQQMANAIQGELTAIQGQAAAANEFNSMNRAFFDIYRKKSPFPDVEYDVNKIIQQSQDPAVMRGYQLVQSYGNSITGDQMSKQAIANQGGGVAPAQQSTAPAGMKQVGTTPSGQPVYEDAQGNRFTP